MHALDALQCKHNFHWDRFGKGQTKWKIKKKYILLAFKEFFFFLSPTLKFYYYALANYHHCGKLFFFFFSFANLTQMQLGRKKMQFFFRNVEQYFSASCRRELAGREWEREDWESVASLENCQNCASWGKKNCNNYNHHMHLSMYVPLFRAMTLLHEYYYFFCYEHYY